MNLLSILPVAPPERILAGMWAMLGPPMRQEHPTSPPDAELVRRVAEGDRDALADLYDRHASILVAVGVRILRNRREAEDIVHDVYLEVWRRAHSYDEKRASVRGWLLLMMRSRSLDRRKSAGFSRGVPLEVEPEAEDHSPELELDRARVVRVLAQLPESQREVLVLGYFEGLSSSEMASQLGLPLGTIKSRVAAALRALRVAMTPASPLATEEDEGVSS